MYNKKENNIKKMRKSTTTLSYFYFTHDFAIVRKKEAIRGKILSKLISRLEQEKRLWMDFHVSDPHARFALNFHTLPVSAVSSVSPKRVARSA